MFTYIYSKVRTSSHPGVSNNPVFSDPTSHHHTQGVGWCQYLNRNVTVLFHMHVKSAHRAGCVALVYHCLRSLGT